mmetsp:Transcript_5887/g.18106  ORF Transcript_5887/g.18106 Transcript_5887/m.18106 type:complete len:241 (-) Transcript_5887:3172-3894(-)
MSSSSAPPIDCAVLDDSTDPDNRPVVLPQAQSAPPAPGMSSMRAGMPSRRSVAALPSNVELNKSSAVMSAAARPPPVAAEQPENSAASSTTASQRSTIPPPPRAAAPSPVQPDSLVPPDSTRPWHEDAYTQPPSARTPLRVASSTSSLPAVLLDITELSVTERKAPWPVTARPPPLGAVLPVTVVLEKVTCSGEVLSGLVVSAPPPLPSVTELSTKRLLVTSTAVPHSVALSRSSLSASK